MPIQHPYHIDSESMGTSSLDSKSRSQTKQKALERLVKGKDKKIRELEALLETISRGKYMWESTFDAISEPVLIVSDDYKIIRANRAVAELGDTPITKLVGKNCYQLIASSEEPCQNCKLKEISKTKKSNKFIINNLKTNEKEYEVNAFPLDMKGENSQTVLYYRDISQEKKLQRQLLQNGKMAAIGTLAGGVAHEINNPLGGVLAFAQLIMRDLPSDHKCQSDLKEIEEAALRCKRIVQDLLDFSRQKSEDIKGPLQINEVIRKLLPLVKVQTKSSAIELKSGFADTLPLVKGCFHKLQQVFLNLITNAYQAMPKGGTLTVKTSFNASQNKVIVTIRDDGEGIPEEYLDKIFDPYFTSKEQGQGTGLGLAISYGIIQEHDGHIDLKTKIGQGTTFTVSFPAIY